jgi:hypothetical protein
VHPRPDLCSSLGSVRVLDDEGRDSICAHGWDGIMAAIRCETLDSTESPHTTCSASAQAA